MDVRDLPDNYTYNHLEGDVNGQQIIHVKQLVDEASAQAWLNDYSKKSKITWRKAKTYPKSGRNNIYKIDLRCEHSTDPRVKGTRPSKNTGCPAKLQIAVQRYYEKSKGKTRDHALIKEWPGRLTFRSFHNHHLGVEESIKEIADISEETEIVAQTSTLTSIDDNLVVEYYGVEEVIYNTPTPTTSFDDCNGKENDCNMPTTSFDDCNGKENDRHTPAPITSFGDCNGKENDCSQENDCSLPKKRPSERDPKTVNYWKDLAEKRRVALSKALAVNKSLHEQIKVLQTDNKNLNAIVERGEQFSGILKVFVEKS